MENTYKRNFLKQVICRIDFTDTPLLNINDFNDKVLSKYFSHIQQKDGFKASVTFQIMEDTVQQSKEKIVIWSYNSQDGRKKAELSDNYLWIIYESYTDKNELLNDAKNIIEPFLEAFKVESIKRIGLRYLNEINLKERNPLNWTKYLNRNLVSQLAFAKSANKKLSRSMSQIVLKENDFNIQFNFGIWNQDFPSQIVSKDFVLDYDCYSDLIFDVKDINFSQKIKEANEYVSNLFELSINKPFRDLLNE